jgi:pimeloyl-ACP methyl ester carboxylesterase
MASVMTAAKITERRVQTNGIALNIAEAGAGPLVLMLHGFPESWYSWRHQFEPLAKAGYKAVAPDMRGYGKSDRPAAISAYNQVEVVNDIIGLIAALGYETAIVLGHDWGAPTAWSCALHHPDKVTAVGALSVPFLPRGDEPPIVRMRKLFAGQFFYQLYFQTPGVAEAELEADVRGSLRKFYHMASGDVDLSTFKPKGPDENLFTGMTDPGKLGDWCSESDLDFYTQAFTYSGFNGPLNYYRAQDLTWELTAGAPTTIQQPAMFMAGDRDGVIMMAAEALQAMPRGVPNLVINELIPGAGHWTQQEAPEAVNRGILEFLRGLPS